MPANDEGKLIAYKWRKSAILETPEQNFLAEVKLPLHIYRTPLTPLWENQDKMTPPPENFFNRLVSIVSHSSNDVITVDHHRRYLPSLLNVQIRAFWKPLTKIF